MFESEEDNEYFKNKSQKIKYLLFLLNFERSFLDLIMKGNLTEDKVSYGFAYIVALCTDKQKREQIYNEFENLKNDGISTNQSASLALGLLTDYILEQLDIIDTQTF